jgi:hypothetical protein
VAGAGAGTGAIIDEVKIKRNFDLRVFKSS